GTKETVRAAERSTFLSYLETWYTPQRIVVGAAGAVDDSFVEEVAAHFGQLEHRAPSSFEPFSNGGSGPKVKLETRDSDQAHLRLSVPGIHTGSPDRYTMQLLTAALGGGMSSRL